MSLTTTALSAATIPTTDLHDRSKKGALAHSAPATTEGLFSSLLQSVEQVIGVVNPAVATALAAVSSAASGVKRL